ncbi:T9SS type A sorting domain-containing protein [Flavobacterium sp. CYK-55]|uniref:T9SS type A sorting domain-containing protein n=1 Tax=Flavobacterium sp. CYK-55 TaxID=2835529 RepID=UPI001BCE3CB5|nr:T9SS type A sorting domain-containing protein [Flavobacterium sp. CYK-55]MBS7788255.1 T9SS type A sorting domain-containing protein [Flavobacterium sp. CYK-55]
MNTKTKLLTQNSQLKELFFFGLFFMVLMNFSSVQAQTLFSQDFSSSTSLSNYINSSAPDAGQFNAITTAGTSTATITSGALRFTRGNSTTSFTRSTNFSTTPTALVYEFDLTVSGTPSGNTATTARWQIGSGYNAATNGIESDANTYAQMAIDFRGTTSFRFNDVSNANTSSNFTVGTTYAITWVMNNSGGTLSYLAPNGNTETIANDRIDFWVGTTRVYNDVVVETTNGTLSDMKFAYVGSTGSITLDNISVKGMATPQVSAFSGNTICSGGTGQLTVTTSAGAGPFTVVYNDGTADRTATNVTSGTAFNAFANPSTTTNYTLVSIAEASGTMRTSSFTDGSATITVNAPTVSVGSALSAICIGGTSSALGGSVGGTATGGTWSDGGIGGTFNPNDTTLNATWTPPANYSGSATLTLTTSGGSCGTTSAAKTQVVNAQPTAIAGGAQTICFGSTATVSGASSSNGTISWTENGAGSITSGAGTLTPVYTPAAGDIGNTVTLTMTVSNSPCASATATYSVTVNPAATVSAGGDQTVCATNPNVTLAGSIGGSATSGTWSGGSGTFSPDNNTLNAVYTPSATELNSGGNITLTLTTNDPDGPCNAVSDSMIVTIKLAPTASAGGTQTICPGTAATVSGASASNGTISWTENGAGSITSGGTGLTPTYTSAAGDAGNTVTLTMTVTNSPCSVATATYTIVVSPAAPAAPGNITGATTVCTGETTTYSVAAVANATTYTWTVPSGWTITDGQGTTSIDVVAGSAGTGNISVVASNSCGSTSPTQSININPISGTNNTGFTSSSTKTSGNITCNSGSLRGYIKFPLSSLPAGASISSATLTLVNNNSATVSGATNNVRALGNTDPTSATASSLYNASGSGTSYSAATWSNTGSVVLTLNSSARTDIQNRISSPGYLAVGLHRGGTADYNFFGFGNGSNSPTLAVDYVAPRMLTVTANLSATVDAGSSVAAVCQGDTTAALGGSFGGSATAAIWDDAGAGGTFTNNSGATPGTTTYTAASNAPASVTLTLTTSGGLCQAVSASKTLVVNANRIVDAGGAISAICQGETTTVLGGSFGGSATSAIWNDGGAGGTFSNNSGTTPETATYTAAANAPALVNLTLVAAGGSCGPTTVSKLLAVNQKVVPAFVPVSPICVGAVLSELPTVSDNGISGTWSPALDNLQTTTYTFTPNAGECALPTTMQIVVHPIVTPTFNQVNPICEGASLAALPTSSLNGVSGSWSPALNNTATTVYTFTPNVGECAVSTTMEITVYPAITPTFDPVAAICSGDVLSALPTTSLNGITGYWTPELNNTTTTTYTFIPDSGQCVSNIATTLTIVVNNNTTYYADADNDGFGDAAVSVQTCLGTPTGYVTNNTDCDAANGSIWRTGMFYIDADGDGYNNGFPQVMLCYGSATPAGYTKTNIGTDCDDSLATVNPNASEVMGNNIDDNCDGIIDEDMPTSYLTSSSCGATLQHISNTLFAYNLAGHVHHTGPVQGYRFKVSNANVDRQIETSGNSFGLLNLPGGAAFATTYTVRVSVKLGGFWRAYGLPCSVTTPAVPHGSYVTLPACGATLSNISNSIFCNQVAGASAYRFRVRNGATVVGTYDSPVNRFSLVNLGVSNISFATTYTIDVLIKIDGQWRPDTEYGNVCTISTPPTPALSRVINPSCGATINRKWTSIFAQQVIGAQGYKFVVTSTDPVSSREYITPNSVFSLMNLPGGATSGVTYTIRVDVLYNGSYVQGVQTCDITVSPSATVARQTDQIVQEFDVKAYPNPFTDSFKFDVKSTDSNSIQLTVYDLLGRQVEAQTTSLNLLSELNIGSKYPSGVYNVVVTQGENVKTLRLVKR